MATRDSEDVYIYVLPLISMQILGLQQRLGEIVRNAHVKGLHARNSRLCEGSGEGMTYVHIV